MRGGKFKGIGLVGLGSSSPGVVFFEPGIRALVIVEPIAHDVFEEQLPEGLDGALVVSGARVRQLSVGPRALGSPSCQGSACDTRAAGSRGLALR